MFTGLCFLNLIYVSRDLVRVVVLSQAPIPILVNKFYLHLYLQPLTKEAILYWFWWLPGRTGSVVILLSLSNLCLALYSSIFRSCWNTAHWPGDTAYVHNCGEKCVRCLFVCLFVGLVWFGLVWFGLFVCLVWLVCLFVCLFVCLSACLYIKYLVCICNVM